MINLILCIDDPELREIGLEEGWKIGTRLPKAKITTQPLYFADQDWKNPRKERYIEDISKYNLEMATVLDLEQEEQFDEVLDWAEKVSKYVNKVIIIPKCDGIISKIPRTINGKEIVLGFSVPSKYGATNVAPSEFSGWKVHLLGGSPHRQLEYAKLFDTYSVDCNYHSMMAHKFGSFWTGKFDGETSWSREFKDTFPESKDWEPKKRGLACFRLSCQNIYKAWLREYD